MIDQGKREFRILFLNGTRFSSELIAYLLAPRGHKVKILSHQTVARNAPSGFDLIMATTYTDRNFLRTLIKAVNAARKANPEAKLILGGPGVSVQPEGFVNLLRADLALMGEADNTIGSLFDCLEGGATPQWEQLKDIPGVVMRSEAGEVHINPMLPVVSEDEIRSQPIFHWWQHGGTGATLCIQRGCPNNCKFCAKSFLGKVRSHSLMSIADKIEEIVKLYPKVEYIHFMSELFLPKCKAKQLISVLRGRGLIGKLNFRAEFTVGSLLQSDGEPDREYIKLLADAGFDQCNIGVEAFSNHLLDELGKPHKGLQAMKVIRALIDCEISGAFYFITTTPKIRLADKIRESHILSAVCTNWPTKWRVWDQPLGFVPGTALWDEYLDQPERFRESLDSKPLDPSTDLRALFRKVPLEFVAAPYDEAVWQSGGLTQSLFAMEARYDYLKDNASDESAKIERSKLRRELAESRLLVSRWPRLYSWRLTEQALLVKQLCTVEGMLKPDFLDRWSAAHPRFAMALRHYYARHIFRKPWEELSEEQQKQVQGELLEWIYRLSKANSRILPREIISEELGNFYDYCLNERWWLEEQLSPFHSRKLDIAFTKATLAMLANLGREQFVEMHMAARDPFWSAGLAMTKVAVEGRSSLPMLRQIEPHSSSLPILEPMLRESTKRRLRKVAVVIPLPSETHEYHSKPV